MTQASQGTASSRSEERWFLLRVLLLVIGLIAGFFIILALRSQKDLSKYPHARLPDGTWLIIRQINVGTDHSIEVPYPFKRRFRTGQRSYLQTLSTSTDRMGIWMMRLDDQGEALDLDWFKAVEAQVDDPRVIKPRHYQRRYNRTNNSSGDSTGMEGFSKAEPFGSRTLMDIDLVHFDLPMIRPQAESITLKIYDGSGIVVTQLKFAPPPLPTQSVENWSPDPLPATQSDGDVSVTLTGVDFRQESHQPGMTVLPQLKFEHRGQPSVTWGSICRLKDPAGNSVDSWNCDLPPGESAWKLTLSASQLPNGRFQADERLILPAKSLAPDGQLKMLSESYDINGLSVSLIGLGGQGPVSFELPGSRNQYETAEFEQGQMNHGWSTNCQANRCKVSFSTGCPFLITRRSKSDSSRVMQLLIRDQNGKSLSSFLTSTIDQLSFHFFELKPETESIELEFIVQKERHFEFIITPPRSDDIKSQ